MGETLKRSGRTVVGVPKGRSNARAQKLRQCQDIRHARCIKMTKGN